MSSKDLMSSGKDLFDQAHRQWLIWNITILLFVFFSLDAIFTAFVSVMIDSNWNDLTGTQKTIRIALVGKAWASAMIAFFTNAQKKIVRNEFPDGVTVTTETSTDTQIIKKP